jgi:uncharacterized protein (DUF433 family)
MSELPNIFERDTDGTIRLKGHRLRLIDGATRYEEGHSPEAIVADYFPTLTLAQVYRSIAFYLENEAEVRAMIDENARTVEQLRLNAPPTPSAADLRKRLEARRRAEAS